MKQLMIVTALVLMTFGSLSVFAEAPNDSAERLRLARELHDIRNIRDRINATVESAAQAVPEADRVDFERYVQLKIDYDALEDKSVVYAAETYTVPELQAMIAYFGSPDGQSAEAKGTTFAEKISKEISKEIDAAIVAARFDGVPETSLPPRTPSSPPLLKGD